MIKRILVIFTVVAGIGFTSCETEFSLNGEYVETPVIFGLLDHLDSIHYIKITKAFLGDGDNLVYAKTPDSNYFKQVDAQIVEFDDGEETGRYWDLRDTIIKTKSTDGLFYAPEQKVYIFRAADLDPELEYRLTGDINEGKLKINSTTTLISGFDISNTVKLPTYKFRFANNSDDPDDRYNRAVKFDVYEGMNAKEYEVGYTIAWSEFYTDGSSSTFSAYRKDDIYQQTRPESPSVFFALFNGEEFYKWVGETVPDDPKVERRTLDRIDINISVAHANLSQYIAVTKPVSSIAQVKPEFTNIENGYGLFSSRIRFVKSAIELDLNSLEELCSGRYTATKLFCE
ncbi:DUF4249 family protein [Crocinitomix catalasitica]|uniref:DUF4249 family protein n=1 Tax=Crocinitomix catalasitica TaxID=184607 RepID=UPI000487A229|nr:DUF4249 family protein [Crocinitomix catalasitica]